MQYSCINPTTQTNINDDDAVDSSHCDHGDELELMANIYHETVDFIVGGIVHHL